MNALAKGSTDEDTFRRTGPSPTHSTETWVKRLALLVEPLKVTKQVALAEGLVLELAVGRHIQTKYSSTTCMDLKCMLRQKIAGLADVQRCRGSLITFRYPKQLLGVNSS